MEGRKVTALIHTQFCEKKLPRAGMVVVPRATVPKEAAVSVTSLSAAGVRSVDRCSLNATAVTVMAENADELEKAPSTRYERFHAAGGRGLNAKTNTPVSGTTLSSAW